VFLDCLFDVVKGCLYVVGIVSKDLTRDGESIYQRERLPLGFKTTLMTLSF